MLLSDPRASIVAVLAILVGCSQPPPEPPPVACAETTDDIRRSILQPSCGPAGCHGAEKPAGDLNLVSGDFEARVFNAPSEACGGLIIVPGKPDESLLISKVSSNAPTCGDRMPLGDALSPDTVVCLRAWIAALPPDAGPLPPVDGGTCTDDEISCDGTCVAKVEPTLASVYDRVFKKSCAFSACHGASSPKEKLNLSSADAFVASTIGVPSLQRPELLRIAPGDPAASYLLDKLKGIDMSEFDSTGTKDSEQMPPSQPICDAKLSVVEAWILAGAPVDAAK